MHRARDKSRSRSLPPTSRTNKPTELSVVSELSSEEHDLSVTSSSSYCEPQTDTDSISPLSDSEDDIDCLSECAPVKGGDKKASPCASRSLSPRGNHSETKCSFCDEVFCNRAAYTIHIKVRERRALFPEDYFYKCITLCVAIDTNVRQDTRSGSSAKSLLRFQENDVFCMFQARIVHDILYSCIATHMAPFKMVLRQSIASKEPLFSEVSQSFVNREIHGLQSCKKWSTATSPGARPGKKSKLSHSNITFDADPMRTINSALACDSKITHGAIGCQKVAKKKIRRFQSKCGRKRKLEGLQV